MLRRDWGKTTIETGLIVVCPLTPILAGTESNFYVIGDTDLAQGVLYLPLG